MKSVKPPAAGNIALLATLDTKGAEVAFLKELIQKQGFGTVVIDVGTGKAVGPSSDIPREEVARASGGEPSRRGELRRDELMELMGRGAGAILKRLLEGGNLRGVLGLGGNQGTAIASIAMRGLPLGFPKLLVSTVASGNMRPYIGTKDITAMFSVADLMGGVNTVSRAILSNAAAAITGMAARGEPLSYSGARPRVAATSFGNTEPAVARARELLQERGYEVIAFHASGACGSAMEELIEEGLFGGVLDLTTHELLGEVLGLDIYQPVRKGRLTAAGRKGIPQVVAPGGLDYYCFGGAETIPPELRGRKTHYHNPYNTNVRASAEELKLVGKELARRLNEARGPTAFLFPLRGWTENGREGGPLSDPEADRALLKSLRESLRPEVSLMEVDSNLNDPP
ncbi:MAG: Tm-1-like ATP-binding domain-containing protein, partial [Nitrospinota bacterium]